MRWADHVHGRTAEIRFARGLAAQSGGEVIGVAVGAGLTLNFQGVTVSAQAVVRRMVLLDFLAVRADRRGEGRGADSPDPSSTGTGRGPPGLPDRHRARRHNLVSL
ncbi:hypothetical protein [Streptomyces yangpuensis]|uniref:hypothetical protein n=1 Tax=Streptomyces yangpuensis TaxID=1648182 RepID=UPI00381CC2C2